MIKIRKDTLIKAAAFTLSLGLILAVPIPVSASDNEITLSGGSATIPVSLTTTNGGIDDGGGRITPTKLSVVLPTTLPLAMADDGTIVTATDCRIVNNSYGAVRVKKVTITAASGWNLTPFGTKASMAREKVNSNKLGFAISIGDGKLVKTTTDADTQTLENFGKNYILTLKGEVSHRVELGGDARGNLIRIDNVLNQIPARIEATKSQLESVRGQLETAKSEVGKPFPQEDELRVKSARLNELNAELNIDERSPIERGSASVAKATAKSERPSVLDKLKSTTPQVGNGGIGKTKKKVEVL